MENPKTFPEIITRKVKFYTPNFIEKWPLNNEFKYENCILCFYILLKPDNGLVIRKYISVEYFKEVTNKILENYKFNNYYPNGFFVLYPDKECEKEIIQDIKCSNYYLE